MRSLIKAFTLIEILVVISIISILVTMSIFALTNAFPAARDNKRKSDLNQYRNALETYANKNNSLYYAVSGNVNPSTTICTPLLGSGATCPDDPNYVTRHYSYQTNGTAGSASATQYALWATLEDVPSTAYWVVCSNGKSGSSATVPSGSGACPLP